MPPAPDIFGGGSVLGIGTAALAVPYGAPGATRPAPEAALARRTLLSAIERGVRFIDTAPAYGDAESLVGAALGDREDCVIATKVAIPQGGWGGLSSEQTRLHIDGSAEASLRALRRERLDVLQVHNADEGLVLRGAVGEALVGLRDRGLVGMTGATVYGEANALAVIASPAFELVQVAFSALDRRAERAVLPAAIAAGTTVVARSLLLRGVLSPAAQRMNGRFAALAAEADAVRVALGASWEELPGAAVAFALSRPGIACALLGPREESELIALLEGAERFKDAVARLELVSPDLPDWLLDPSRWPPEPAGVH
jgi:aryl-alcohol dehydrogenase-like predicted oxidoreductase